MALENLGNAIIEDIANVPVDTATVLISELGKIGNWLQAIGIIVILWIVFQLISLIVDYKKRKALYRIEKQLKVLEKKIDKLSNKK